MITVVNFSHPLSADACDFIAREWGGDAAPRVIDVRVQIDFSQPVAAQCRAVAAAALNVVGGNGLNVDCIILPGLAVVAAYLARRFLSANIIVVAPVAGATPVRFMPVELIQAGGSRDERSIL